MRRGDDGRVGEQRREALRVAPPEDRHQRLRLAVRVHPDVKGADGGLGDGLPSLA